MKINALWRLGAVCGLLSLAACSSLDQPKPAPLEAVTPRLALKQAWSAKLGTPLAGLSVAVLPDRFVLANRDGQVVTLDADSGAERSRVAVGSKLSAGVGSDGRFSAVVTEANELVVIDGTKERWRARLPARVVTAPLVAGERVFIQAVDRTVQAYDALDGRKLWSLSRSGEALALAQPGVLLAVKDMLVVGLGSRLVAIDPLLGNVRNEMALANPRGTNEVERLADLVGPAARLGDSVCARAFQAAVTCADVERNRTAWSRNLGGYQGVAGDADQVYAADASDRITAWRRNSGDVAWTSERLRNRTLSTPVALPAAVVFGDFEGWLHFLSRERGDTLLRLPTDGSAVAALVRSGTTLLAVSRNGGVYAYRPQ